MKNKANIKIYLILSIATIVTILFVSCNTETVNVTFSQGDGYPDVIVAIEKGGTISDLPTPKSVTGYDVRWEDKDLTSIQGDTIVKAIKTPIQYQITYVLNGGSNHSSNISSYDITTTHSFLAPQKTGYIFNGWFKNEDLSEPISKISAGQTGNITLYASWESEEYDITFVQGDGYPDVVLRVKRGESITELPKPKNVLGYDVKWEDKDLTSIQGAMTINAVKTLIDYPINYMNLDGAANLNPKTYNIESGFTLINPVRSNYVFLGWYSDESLKTPITEIRQGTTGELNIYASWIEYDPDMDYAIITFDTKGGSTIEPQAILKNTAITEPEEPTKAGYIFDGWYYNGELWKFVGYTASESITLEAQWKLEYYKIEYFPNGGVINTSKPITYNTEMEIASLPMPVKDGYTFGGWYTESTLQNLLPQIAKGTTGNLSLYARWIAKDNVLVLDANGASGNMESVTVKTDETISLPQNQFFINEYYKFSGWSTSADGQVEYLDGAEFKMSPNGPFALYAIWEKLPVTITIDSNGATGGSVENISVVPGNAFTVPKNTFTKEGYAVREDYEWSLYCNTCGSYSCGETELDSSLNEGDEVIVPSYHDYKLIALFRALGYYDLKLIDSNGVQVRTLADNEKVGTLPTLEREGYTFLGWYGGNFTNKLTGDQYLSCDMIIMPLWTKNTSTEPSNPCGPSENIAKYAEIIYFSGQEDNPSTEADESETGMWWAVNWEALVDGDITTGTSSPKIGSYKLIFDYYKNRQIEKVVFHCNGKGFLDNGSFSTIKEDVFNNTNIEVLIYSENGVLVQELSYTNINTTFIEIPVYDEISRIEFQIIGGAQLYSGAGYLWEMEIFESKAEHNYEMVDVLTPTCSTNGAYVYECQCGARKYEMISKNEAHIYIEDYIDEETGITYYTCVLCEETMEKLPLESGHSWDNGTVVLPTCAEQGYTEYKCTDNGCEMSYKTDFTLCLGHIWDEGYVSKLPTSDECGERVLTCQRDGCDASYVLIIPVVTYNQSTSDLDLELGNTVDMVELDFSNCPTSNTVMGYYDPNDLNYPPPTEQMIHNMFDSDPSTYFYGPTGTKVEIHFDRLYYITAARIFASGNYTSVIFEFYTEEDNQSVLSARYEARVDNGMDRENLQEINLKKVLGTGVAATKMVITINYAKWGNGFSNKIHEIELEAHSCIGLVEDVDVTDPSFVAPNCTTDGSCNVICRACGKTVNVTIPKEYGHDGKLFVDKEPTHTEEGLAHIECQNDGCLFISDYIVLDALKECNLNNCTEISLIKATENTSGINAIVCSECKRIVTYIIVYYEE